MNFSSMRIRHTLTGIKSDLVSCLEELVNSLDGSVIVNMLRPGSAKTFSDYASQVFLPYKRPSCSKQVELTSFGMSTVLTV